METTIEQQQISAESLEDVRLTSKCIVAFEIMYRIDAAAMCNHRTFAEQFEIWKQEFKQHPDKIDNPFMQKNGLKVIDMVTAEMVLNDYNTMISGFKKSERMSG